MAPSERNNNMVPSLQVKSNGGDSADVILWADPTTHRLLVNAILNGLPVGGSTIAHAATSISSSAQIVAANTSRIKVIILNPIDAADFLYVGASGVTTANGLPLPQGSSITLDTTAAVHGIAASGTISVRYIEISS